MGPCIQKKLGWKSHIQTIISKLRFRCSVIYRIRSSANVSCLLALYHALATNYVNFCVATHHAGKVVLLNQIQKQCYKIIRSVFYREKVFEYNDVYRNYGIL